MSPDVYSGMVYVREAARRRNQGAFYWTLLSWAANARQRAMRGQKRLFA